MSDYLKYRLKLLRRRYNWTQEFTAHECGLSCPEYQKLEQGKGNPTLSTLLKIARTFAVSLDFLTGWKVPHTIPIKIIEYQDLRSRPKP
jgi:transcriptional regulator with XRE-family HTH domain